MNFLQYPRREHDYHLTQCTQREGSQRYGSRRYGCCMYYVDVEIYPYGECTDKRCIANGHHAFDITCYTASPHLLGSRIGNNLRPSNEWYRSYDHGLFQMNYIFINRLCQEEMKQIDMLTYRGALRRVWNRPIRIIAMSGYTYKRCIYCYDVGKMKYKDDMISTATTIVNKYWKGTPLPFLSSHKMSTILSLLPSSVVRLKKSYILLKIAYFAQKQILKAYSCRVIQSIVPDDIYRYISSYLIPYDAFYHELKRFHLICRCLQQAQQVHAWKMYSI